MFNEQSVTVALADSRFQMQRLPVSGNSRQKLLRLLFRHPLSRSRQFIQLSFLLFIRLPFLLLCAWP